MAVGQSVQLVFPTFAAAGRAGATHVSAPIATTAKAFIFPMCALFIDSVKGSSSADPNGRARVILSERFAKGEITKEEYQERRRERSASDTN
jgi:uncharacterized membrane protein